jgi:reverse transcriptase-like protein
LRRCIKTPGLSLGGTQFSKLAFADDLVLIEESKEELQKALDSFNKECSRLGMRVSVAKTKIMVCSRKPEAVSFKIGGSPLEQVDEFVYLGSVFRSNCTVDNDIRQRKTKAKQVLAALYQTIVRKREVPRSAKRAIYKSVYRPVLMYGHESWPLNNERRLMLKSAEMDFVRAAMGVSRRDQWTNIELRRKFKLEQPLLVWAERSQLKWFGHVVRMSEDRLPRQLLFAIVTGKKYPGGRRKNWLQSLEEPVTRCGLRNVKEAEATALDRRAWRATIKSLPPRPLAKGESG